MSFYLTDRLLLHYMRRLVKKDRRDRSLSSLSPPKVSSILVVSTTGLGDSVLSTPAIHAVRQAFPRARITGHFHKKYVELFNGHPDLDQVIPYEGTFNRRYRKFFSTIKAFRKEQFDLAFIFHGNDPQAVPMAYLSGAPMILRRPSIGAFDFLLSNPQGDGEYSSEHAIIGRLKTAQLAGCSMVDQRMILSPKALPLDKLNAFYRDIGLPEDSPKVAFQVGASYAYKCWPEGHFIELGRRLLQKNQKLCLLIMGSGKEKHRCRRILKGIRSPRTFNLAGQCSIGMMAALIHDCHLLVTNDTGPLHVAIALGTKTVSFFGPTSPELFGPLQDPDRHLVFYQKTDCRPCLQKKCRAPHCLSDIPVGGVVLACEKQLYQQTGV
jgi:ADP-heptose:LPS heptosyltransferase